MKYEVLQRDKWERNILCTIERRKANWTGRNLRRDFLLKHIIKGKMEGRVEVTGRRARRCKQLLDDSQEKRRNWNLKKEAPDRTLWRTCFERGCGTV